MERYLIEYRNLLIQQGKMLILCSSFNSQVKLKQKYYGEKFTTECEF